MVIRLFSLTKFVQNNAINKIDIKNKTVVIIASGGNVDPDIFEKSLKISI